MRADTFNETQQKVADWLHTRFAKTTVRQFQVASCHTTITRYSIRPNAAGVSESEVQNDANCQVLFTAIDGENVIASLDLWKQYITSGNQINGYTPMYLTLTKVIEVLNARPSSSLKYVIINKVVKSYTDAHELRAVSDRTLIYCFNLGDGSPENNAELHQSAARATNHYLAGQDFNFTDAVSPIITVQDYTLQQFASALAHVGIPKECSVSIMFDKDHEFMAVPKWTNDKSAYTTGAGSFSVCIDRIDMILGFIDNKFWPINIRKRTPRPKYSPTMSYKPVTILLQHFKSIQANEMMFGGISIREAKNLFMAALAIYISMNIS